MDREKTKGGLLLVRVMALVSLLLVVCVPGQSFGKEKSGGAGTVGVPEYTIGLGDQLRVLVWKEPDLTIDVSVRVDGQVSLPLLGDVPAAGKTIMGLAADIERRYGEVLSEPAVSVILLQSKSWRYYIIGKIAKPGEYAIDYPVTVLQAIARSGGFLEWAKQEEIEIVRRTGNEEKIIPFDYTAFSSGKNMEQNIVIQPGDTIIVP